LQHYWSLGLRNFTANDIEFTESILNAVQDLYCIDKNRIFAAGKSQGAGLVGRLLACEPTLSQTFAAFALVAPLLYTDVQPCVEPYQFPIPCSPGRTDVPILEFHGGRDRAAKYRGDYARRPGECLPSVPWWIKTWARNNGLDTKGNTMQLAADTPTTSITKYGSGDKEGLVTHVFDSKLGHDWPSKSNNSDNNGRPAKFEATPMILDFFDAHPLRGSPALSAPSIMQTEFDGLFQWRGGLSSNQDTVGWLCSWKDYIGAAVANFLNFVR
jgi:poly(3-hydroxybutyrate) depolymerase